VAITRIHKDELGLVAGHRPVRRVAMIAVHSNPLAEPGAGDSGGMTVYIRQIAKSMSARDVEVDIYTRRDASGLPDVAELHPGVRVIQIEAGEPGISKEEIPAHLPEFTQNLLRTLERVDRYDLIHSHYWLAGRVASRVSGRLSIPFVHTFHSLGRAKNASAGRETREPELRLAGEDRVIREADAIVASTCEERRWLINLYAAHHDRVHVIPPGVDHDLFSPGDQAKARRRLGLSAERVLLFVGRLQPLKAANIAICAVSHLIRSGRLSSDETKLLVVGGPSGLTGDYELERLKRLTHEVGLDGVVEFVPARPHQGLSRYYRAADVCLVPSLTETFGLVALEAQACGVPVVASAVGGLSSVVRHGETGFLVEPNSIEDFADRSWQILSDQQLRNALASCAASLSHDFSWSRSAGELYELYSAISQAMVVPAEPPC
jgi:D-inositol-3-phosphate glycosyltransferase